MCICGNKEYEHLFEELSQSCQRLLSVIRLLSSVLCKVVCVILQTFVFAPWIITFILLSDFTLNLYVITPAKRIIFPPLHFLHMKFSQKKKKKKKKPLQEIIIRLNHSFEYLSLCRKKRKSGESCNSISRAWSGDRGGKRGRGKQLIGGKYYSTSLDVGPPGLHAQMLVCRPPPAEGWGRCTGQWEC